MSASSRPPAFRLSRRRVLGGLAIVPAASTGALAQGWRRGGHELDYPFPGDVADRGLGLAPTPACGAGGAELTARQTEGPYYSPDTPRRDDLTDGVEGPPLVVMGRVLTPDCRPIANAVLDFWQADSQGRYDNQGYRLRGHQFADAAGMFRLATIRPGGYGYASAARPPHIHVKVQGQNTELLTTQLYFPDAPNDSDRIFRPSLVMALSEAGGVQVGRFDFVLPAA